MSSNTTTDQVFEVNLNQGEVKLFIGLFSFFKVRKILIDKTGQTTGKDMIIVGKALQIQDRIISQFIEHLVKNGLPINMLEKTSNDFVELSKNEWETYSEIFKEIYKI